MKWEISATFLDMWYGDIVKCLLIFSHPESLTGYQNLTITQGLVVETFLKLNQIR